MFLLLADLNIEKEKFCDVISSLWKNVQASSLRNYNLKDDNTKIYCVGITTVNKCFLKADSEWPFDKKINIKQMGRIDPIRQKNF